MLSTSHKLFYQNSQRLQNINDKYIDLVVTSPPYPMIEMWDELFISMNCDINDSLNKNDGDRAFKLMHEKLDAVWREMYRIIKDGGFLCINIGDATRSIGNTFRLYANHSRIQQFCCDLGFESLPVVLWRKQTNAPNKFMGSGMLPSGAYVTLEHEYVLIFRKNGKREFKTSEDKLNRQKSAFFWEERNTWFSEIWDFKGIRQDINHQQKRKRSGAFPFELAYRLINMYSAREDIVLDPFIGTGTTMFAAMASCRNSLGVEIDKNFKTLIDSQVNKIYPFLNAYIKERINKHLSFITQYEKEKGKLKYSSIYHQFPVMTSQEQNILFNYLKDIEIVNDDHFNAVYFEEVINDPANYNVSFGESVKNSDISQLALAF